eukprot:1144154-Pelagomonas_calceolata.AAC.7
MMCTSTWQTVVQLFATSATGLCLYNWMNEFKAFSTALFSSSARMQSFRGEQCLLGAAQAKEGLAASKAAILTIRLGAKSFCLIEAKKVLTELVEKVSTERAVY